MVAKIIISIIVIVVIILILGIVGFAAIQKAWSELFKEMWGE